jgi:hypothetical protein
MIDEGHAFSRRMAGVRQEMGSEPGLMSIGLHDSVHQ